MVTQTLTVDIAAGVAEWEGMDVDVGLACLIHIGSGTMVWQHSVAVPLSLPDWLERCVAHLSTLRHHMSIHWPEVEAYVDWWMLEPGVDERYPHGLQVT